MSRHLAEVIPMDRVLKRNLVHMLVEHCCLDFGKDCQEYFNRFGTQIELIHSKLETDFSYLSDKTKNIVRDIYRQYECIVKGKGHSD